MAIIPTRTGVIDILRLMGADPFSLDGAVALGWVHPIGIGMFVLFPVGLGAVMIAMSFIYVRFRTRVVAYLVGNEPAGDPPQRSTERNESR